ncbi:carbohydrate ABC transporter permease [Caldanaerobius polysaccharolyticus]|uniref:carbohydrate ABC transporter permease n=1 Tax=Caldanaerobius polysaccharolyticus TaxID=44256 RepID=UPI00068F2889|nr:sugar ABC transporter permease [Caldanaerobius polysaccharolyticus]
MNIAIARNTSTRYGKTKRIYNDLLAAGFLAPYFVFFIVFTLAPIFYGLWVSFNKWSLTGRESYVGFDNYLTTIKDVDFWLSLWHTTFFTIISTPVLVILPLLLALILDQNLKGKTALRAIFFIPNILSVAVISSAWVFMLQPYTGFLNYQLHQLGIKSEPFWLNDPKLAWFSIVLITTWWTIGFNMILFLAGLQDIPQEHYEAAAIDGASPWQMIRYITLPALRGLILLITILQIIASFKVFGQIWLVTRGGPGNATRPIIQYIYETGFTSNELGLASAMSFLFFIVLVVLSFLQVKYFGKNSND